MLYVTEQKLQTRSDLCYVIEIAQDCSSKKGQSIVVLKRHEIAQFRKTRKIFAHIDFCHI